MKYLLHHIIYALFQTIGECSKYGASCGALEDMRPQHDEVYGQVNEQKHFSIDFEENCFHNDKQNWKMKGEKFAIIFGIQ